MALTRVHLGLVVLLSFASARATLADPTLPPLRRIRSFEARLQALLEHGRRESPTFHALTTRLERSDLIVYVLSDVCPLPHVAGRLTFLSAVGGVRYVVVRLRPLGSTLQVIAVLAHELQHAVEIADHRAIVDAHTLAREYMRIGHVNPWMAPGTAFDTRAAIDAGYQVHRELAAGADVRDADASGE